MPSLPDNVTRLRDRASPCRLCPRGCGAQRADGQAGSCGVGLHAIVCSAGPHFGEEAVLVGPGGSGTIFFSGCNLHCVFCQNHDISQAARGQVVSARQVARLALDLQARGCANVNFVTPTHVAHVVGEAVHHARRKGLTVPVVYNCGGYESLETLRLLEGLVDIYMPDFKYARAPAGLAYSDAEDYPAVARAALAEMYSQVGPLQVGDGLAVRGVLVRHLVLPGDLAGGCEVVDLVAAAAPGCAVNIMGQYHPAYRAWDYPELTARPDAEQVRSLRTYATECGLQRVDA